MAFYGNRMIRFPFKLDCEFETIVDDRRGAFVIQVSRHSLLIAPVQLRQPACELWLPNKISSPPSNYSAAKLFSEGTLKPQPPPPKSGTCTATCCALARSSKEHLHMSRNQPPSHSFIPSNAHLSPLDEPRNPLSGPQLLPLFGINRSSSCSFIRQGPDLAARSPRLNPRVVDMLVKAKQHGRKKNAARRL
jgi:hypothetical protein